MIRDLADDMLEVMQEARHEGTYRWIEVITGRRQRRNWTDDEKGRTLAFSGRTTSVGATSSQTADICRLDGTIMSNARFIV